MRNLDWSLLREGGIFLTWIIQLEIRENLGFDLDLKKKRKVNYVKGQTFFSVCTSVNQKEHYEAGRVAGDLN